MKQDLRQWWNDLTGRPFTGAWIETPWPRGKAASPSVAPSRGRGLKLVTVVASGSGVVVAPSRGRGLKLAFAGTYLAMVVAPSRGRGLKHYILLFVQQCGLRRPFTGAWIETPRVAVADRAGLGRPFTGAWIETPATDRPRQLLGVAPSRGRGLKPLFRPT